MNKFLQEKVINKSILIKQSFTQCQPNSQKSDIHEAIKKEYYKILFLSKEHLQRYQEFFIIFVNWRLQSRVVAYLHYFNIFFVKDEQKALILLQKKILIGTWTLNLKKIDYLIDFTVSILQNAYKYILKNYLTFTLYEDQKGIANDPIDIHVILFRDQLYWSSSFSIKGQIIKDDELNLGKGLQLDSNNIDFLLLTTKFCKIDISFNVLQKTYDLQPANIDIKNGYPLQREGQCYINKGYCVDTSTLLDKDQCCSFVSFDKLQHQYIL